MTTRNAVLATIAVVLLGGVAGSGLGALNLPGRIAQWRIAKVQRGTVADHWGMLTDGQRLDSGTGPVGLIVFGDYECSFCRRGHHELKRFALEHPDVGIVYRHMPLTDIHPLAMDASRAAVCAGKQGAFLTMHQALYESETWLETGDWAAIAEHAAIPEPLALVACVESHQVDSELRTDAELVERLGLSGTPTFITRTQIVNGLVPVEELARLLEQADW